MRRRLAGLGLLLFVCAATGLASAAPRILWEYRIAGSAKSFGLLDVKTDSSGDCYVVGNFYGGNLRFSPTLLIKADPSAALLVKVSRSGALRWVRKTDVATGLTMCVDDGGNAYVGGYGTANLVKYSPDGRLLWKKQFTGAVLVRDVTPAPGGGCYVLAETWGEPTVHFDPITITNNGGLNLCLARLDSEGKAMWAQWCASGRTHQTTVRERAILALVLLAVLSR